MFYVFTRDYIPFYDREHNHINYNTKDGAKQSTVSVEGKRVVDLQYRNSLSIRDSFETKVDLSVYIPNYKIAVGHKHIYGPGQFMESHYDSEKEPINDKKHIATLIIICPGSFTGGDLIIEDKLVDYDKSVFTCVLMSIKCIHKVNPVITGERHSFVFPVYGEFNLSRGFLKYYGGGELMTIYDRVLKYIGTFDYAAESSAELQGYIKMLDDRECTGIANKIRKLIDRNCYAEYDNLCELDELESPYVLVTYDWGGITHNLKLSQFETTTYKIPYGAINITIESIGYAKCLMNKLKKCILELKEADLTEYEESVKSAADISQIDKILRSANNQLTVVIYLSGRYRGTDTLDNLVASDKSLFNYLERHYKFTFYPAADIRIDYLLSFHYENGILWTKRTDIREYKTSLMSELDVEFNDDDGYDPICSLGAGAFLLTERVSL